ncbi:hypothetical protein V2J09_021470 [Rumex salicifolius]
MQKALEQEYGCKLCIGPCTTRGEGFYYDAFYGDLGLNEDHFQKIKSKADKAVEVEIINDLPEFGRKVVKSVTYFSVQLIKKFHYVERYVYEGDGIYQTPIHITDEDKDRGQSRITIVTKAHFSTLKEAMANLFLKIKKQPKEEKWRKKVPKHLVDVLHSSSEIFFHVKKYEVRYI